LRINVEIFLLLCKILKLVLQEVLRIIRRRLITKLPVTNLMLLLSHPERLSAQQLAEAE
jgi:hypothetical protein